MILRAWKPEANSDNVPYCCRGKSADIGESLRLMQEKKHSRFLLVVAPDDPLVPIVYGWTLYE
jgi:hypothetical protein